LKTRLRNFLKLRDMVEKLRVRFTKVGIDQLKEGIEFKMILILMRSLLENRDERNKFLAKRFIIRKWYMQVKKLIERDDLFNKAMIELDRKYLTNTINTLADISEATKVLKAIPVARAADFFTQLKKIWRDWVKERIRILDIMGKYLEREDDEKNNMLKKKILQWRDNARDIRKEAAKIRIAKWISDKFKNDIAVNNWKELAGKYKMLIQKTFSYQLKSRLINWLKLRDFAEKLKNRLTLAGKEQFKEGIEFKKILVLMKSYFTNLEEKNKFLVKRYFIRKWYMQVKKQKHRDNALDKAMKEIERKYLTNIITAVTDITQAKRVLKAVPAARAANFFAQLRKVMGDWDKYRRRIMTIMGNYLESEDKKRMMYLLNNEIKNFCDSQNIKENKDNSNKDIIIKKLNNEIDKLKEKLSRYPFELSKGEKLISVIFTSSDQNMLYSIICKNTQKFNELEKKLYKVYPEYSESNNYFMINGNRVKKTKSLDENKIKNNDIIILTQNDI